MIFILISTVCIIILYCYAINAVFIFWKLFLVNIFQGFRHTYLWTLFCCFSVRKPLTLAQKWVTSKIIVISVIVRIQRWKKYRRKIMILAWPIPPWSQEPSDFGYIGQAKNFYVQIFSTLVKDPFIIGKSAIHGGPYLYFSKYIKYQLYL